MAMRVLRERTHRLTKMTPLSVKEMDVRKWSVRKDRRYLGPGWDPTKWLVMPPGESAIGYNGPTFSTWDDAMAFVNVELKR